MIGESFAGTAALALLLIGTMVLLLSKGIKLSSLDIVVSFAFFALILANTAVSNIPSFSNYLIAPIIALSISKCARPMFVSFMICHAFVSVLLQAYEHMSGAYIFNVAAEDGTILDSLLFSGHADIMRAKGLFQGPLSAVAFYILVSLLHPGMRTILIGMVGAILAYGRLGIILTTSLFAARLLSNFGLTRKIIIIMISIGGLVIAPELVTLPTFFSAAFDLTSSGNVARFYFWNENLSHYSDYSVASALFGNLGYANRVIGSTESDFLRILMDTGLFTLLIYISVLIGVLQKAVYMGYEKTFHFFVIIIAMAVFPFIQSLNATIIFWVYIWGFFHGHEEN